MDLSVFTFAATVDDLVEQAGIARDQGFRGLWMSQIFGIDALTSIAVAGREVPDIEFGTAVVPTYPRHPMMLAQQALTVNQAIAGRLLLGIGLSHQPVVEGMWGYSFDKPVRHMKEYLGALGPLLRERSVSVSGETVTARGTIEIEAPAPKVMVAALGTQMLKVAGRLADGTMLWMTGPATIAQHTVPTITEAAEAAGRPAPEIMAGLPVCVTDGSEAQLTAARERAAKDFAIYGQLPSYRAMLDREGASGPEDVAIIGAAGEVEDRIRALGETGLTGFAAAEFGTGDQREATRSLLVTLLD